MAVIFPFLDSSRVKARDAERRSDIRQITLALELYADANGTYPASGGATAPGAAWSNSSDSSWTTLETKLSPFISKLPQDPKQSTDPNIWGAGGYAYSYAKCNANTYMFVYQLEQAKGPDLGTYCGATFYQYGGSGANTKIKTIGNKAY